MPRTVQQRKKLSTDLAWNRGSRVKLKTPVSNARYVNQTMYTRSIAMRNQTGRNEWAKAHASVPRIARSHAINIGSAKKPTSFGIDAFITVKDFPIVG